MKYLAMLLLFITGYCTINASPFYIGGIFSHTNTDVNSTLTYPLDSSPPKVATSDLSLSTLDLGVTMGYAQKFSNNWGVNAYIDLLANYGSNTREIEQWFVEPNAQVINASVKVSTPLTTALTTALTYQWHPDLALLFGPTVADTTFKSNAGVTGGNIGVSGNFQKNLVGVGATLGLIYNLSTPLSLRLTDSYIRYPAVTWSAIEQTSEQDLSEQYKLNSNALRIGIDWNF